MAVYFEPYQARVRSDELEKERQYNEQVQARELTYNTLGNIAQTIFRYSELHKAEQKDKFESISALGAMYGWDHLPQSALNSWAGAADSITGAQIIPRSPDGNALPPPQSFDEMTRNYLRSMGPEEQQKYIKAKLFPHSDMDEWTKKYDLMEHDRKARHDESMERFKQIEADASMIRANKTGSGGGSKVSDSPSGYTFDPKLNDGAGDVRRSKEGETQLTNKQFSNFEADERRRTGDSRAERRLKADIDMTKWKMDNDPGLVNKLANQTLKTADDWMKSKEPRLRDAGRQLAADTIMNHANDLGLTTVTKDKILAELSRGNTGSSLWARLFPGGAAEKPAEAQPDPNALDPSIQKWLDLKNGGQ